MLRCSDGVIQQVALDLRQPRIVAAAHRLLGGDQLRNRCGAGRDLAHGGMLEDRCVVAGCRKTDHVDIVSRLERDILVRFDGDTASPVMNKDGPWRPLLCNSAAHPHAMTALRFRRELQQTVYRLWSQRERIARRWLLHGYELEPLREELHADKLPAVIEERSANAAQLHRCVDQIRRLLLVIQTWCE